MMDVATLKELPIYMKHLIVNFFWHAQGKDIEEKLMIATNKMMEYMKNNGLLMQFIDGRMLLSSRGIQKQKNYLTKSPKVVLRKKEIKFQEIMREMGA